jgi:Cu2+-exporting ATPase
VISARVNFSAKAVHVRWSADSVDAGTFIAALDEEGFDSRVRDPGVTDFRSDQAYGRLLLRSLAVAGFAAGNVMLLSVSVWSGAEAATRELLHWISALIALPAIIYAGRPFFASAWQALSRKRLNMDVPISLAVLLAGGMSLYETAMGGAHAYFDAAVMLLFFLLAGRYLDHMMRGRAHSALTGLIGLQATGATVETGDGRRQWMDIKDVAAGMTVCVAAGERLPVDGTITDGHSDLDRSLVTGESAPEAVGPGSKVEAGTINLTGALKVSVSATGAQTVLSQIADLMVAAQQSQAHFVRLADRAARVYAPLVHLAALVTFIGWLWTAGDWHFALLTAIAVLIITCPCALGLAVPAVQVVATGKLFSQGVMVKDGSALERLAEVDTVIFDKTGTLTTGKPEITGMDAMTVRELELAAGLSRESRHPLSMALSAHIAQRGIEPADFSDVVENPGFGMSGTAHEGRVLLGSREWCTADCEAVSDHAGPELYLQIAGKTAKRFRFEDSLREDARETIEALRHAGLKVVLLSGDSDKAVIQVATRCGISDYRGGWKPQDKAAYVQSMQAGGHKVLMIGDGINDAPALGLAHASMAPSSAADISGKAANLVFLGNDLMVVREALETARQARRLVYQNFGLAALYNLIAVPVAVAGLATPLVAAIAMSSSSLIVTTNALRLRLSRRPERTRI